MLVQIKRVCLPLFIALTALAALQSVFALSSVQARSLERLYSPEGGGSPIPGEHCGDVGPLPPYPADWCGCVWGMVYVEGQPVSGITVTLSHAGHNYSMVTIEGDEPIFAIDGRWVSATLGSPMTLSATYNGQTITRTYHALPDPHTLEQQVNLVFPQSEGNAPTAVITDITTQIDRAILGGGGTDNDEGGSQILGYEWSSNLDGVIGTEADVNIPLSFFTQDLHLISLRVQDDEGQWSTAVSQPFDLLDLYPLFITPDLNSFTALTDTVVTLTYNHSINPISINPSTISLHASTTSSLTVTYNSTGATTTLNPSKAFLPGEQVEFTITDGIAGSGGQQPTKALVGRFSVAPQGGSGYFTDGGTFANPYTGFAQLADVDGDGDLDLVANGRPGSLGKILLNNGLAQFVDSGQILWSTTKGLDIGDLDGDGDLDIYTVADIAPSNDEIWLNDGTGHFTPTGQQLGDTSNAHAVELGDVDGDGDLDAFVGVYSDQPEEIWLNDGNAYFTNSGQALGTGDSVDVELGDVDRDGDLDALVINFNYTGNSLYLNNGDGIFTDSGQVIGTLTNSDSQRAALQDLDGDNDLDVFIVNQRAKPDEVWFNDGEGNFYDSGQRLDAADGEGLSLGDIDGDSDLDAFIGNENDVSDPADTVWFNNGDGYFSDSGQRLGSDNSVVALMGDLDGDGDLDVLVNSSSQTGSGNDTAQVWLNSDATPYLSINKTAPTTAYAGSPIRFTLQITNTGNISATNVIVTDTLPTGATYVSGGTLGANNIVTWEVPSLPSGGHVALDLVVTATSTIINFQYGVTADGGIAITGTTPVMVQVFNPPPTTWLVLLYLDGDNNLQPWLENALTDLQNTGIIGPNVRVLALIDGNESDDTSLYEAQDGLLIPLDPNEEWYSPEVNMGRDETLSGFVNWAQTHYQSQYTYLSIANHGAGVRGISWDETSSNDYLNPGDLTAFAASFNGHIDVLHLDACLMSMAELAYLFRDKADYLIASQNLAWSVFAYDQYVAGLDSRLPDEQAVHIANTYAAHLSDYPHTITALDLNQMEALNTALATLTEALLTGNYQSELNAVLNQVQRFDSHDYFQITTDDEFIDLYHFAELLQEEVNNASVDSATQVIMAVLADGQGDSVILYEHHLSGSLGAYYWDLEGAHGLSIYYPSSADSLYYDDYLYDYPYTFIDSSGWRSFLETYVGVPDLTPLPPNEPAPTLFVYSVFLPIAIQGD